MPSIHVDYFFYVELANNIFNNFSSISVSIIQSSTFYLNGQSDSTMRRHLEDLELRGVCVFEGVRSFRTISQVYKCSF